MLFSTRTALNKSEAILNLRLFMAGWKNKMIQSLIFTKVVITINDLAARSNHKV